MKSKYIYIALMIVAVAHWVISEANYRKFRKENSELEYKIDSLEFANKWLNDEWVKYKLKEAKNDQ